MKTVFLKIRRFDVDEKDTHEITEFRLNSNLDYSALKQEVRSWVNVNENDDKVVKLRNKNLVLLPLADLLDGNSSENYFVLDVSKIQQAAKTTANHQEAYLDAVHKKIQNIELRIAQVELSIPQTQQKRQANMEQTVQTMGNRVAFLDKRIDDLMPPQWKSKMPVTIS